MELSLQLKEGEMEQSTEHQHFHVLCLLFFVGRLKAYI